MGTWHVLSRKRWLNLLSIDPYILMEYSALLVEGTVCRRCKEAICAARTKDGSCAIRYLSSRFSLVSSQRSQTMASPPSVVRLCPTFLAASLFQALFHRPTIVLFYEVFCVLLLVKFAPPIFRRLLSRKTVFLLKIVRSKSASNHGTFVGQI